MLLAVLWPVGGEVIAKKLVSVIQAMLIVVAVLYGGIGRITEPDDELTGCRIEGVLVERRKSSSLACQVTKSSLVERLLLYVGGKKEKEK